MGNIQSKARPQESHSHSQRVYHCEMVSTGVQGWDLGSTHSIKLHPGRAVRLFRGKGHTVSAELRTEAQRGEEACLGSQPTLWPGSDRGLGLDSSLCHAAPFSYPRDLLGLNWASWLQLSRSVHF